MKGLIKYIAQALVDHPEAAEVSEVEGGQTSVIELKVAKDDLGKIIGKQGQWFCNQRPDDRGRMTGRLSRTDLWKRGGKIPPRRRLYVLRKF
jgi:hypothetical protein